MHDIERGFRIDGRRIDWGATLETVAAKLAAPRQGERIGYTTLRVPCGEAYGFDALAVELSGYGLSRPVTALAFDLALPEGGRIEPECWTGPLVGMLGSPREQTVEDVADRSDPGAAVRYYFNWERGDVSVGLSVFGGPRETPEGRSAAILWVSWSIDRAASPFLPEWRAACESLAVAAKHPSGVRTFQLGLDQHPLHGGAGSDRRAWLALAAPDILLTPAPIAAGLSKRRFALWSNAQMKVHCLSTRWDSVIWDAGAGPRIDWWHVLPAKGPGQSALHAGNWSVVDFFDSTSVPDAIGALDSIPGVKVNRLDGGYDC
jgi:hypothetical protein